MGPCRLSPLLRCWPVSLPRATRRHHHPPTMMVHSPSLPPRRWMILRWQCHPVLPKYTVRRMSYTILIILPPVYLPCLSTSSLIIDREDGGGGKRGRRMIGS